jgi:tetratricopeptide (TPR) repeat protein
MKCHDRALEIDPNDPRIIHGKALALMDIGEYEKCIQWIDAVLRLDPREVYALGNRGMALHSMGKCVEALEWYDKALKIGKFFFFGLLAIFPSLFSKTSFLQRFAIHTRHKVRKISILLLFLVQLFQ